MLQSKIYNNPDWYKDVVAYQVYIRSFKDSNGDGVGDLAGVREKIDYLAQLGVGLIWLSPFCASPNDDNGYDVSDYQNIMSDFGSLQDFDALVAEAHKRNIRIMMDLVYNHSSDRHPWFVQSRSSRDNPYRAWYHWRDGRTGKDGKDLPPNNWDSYFGGPAWTFDAETEQWYCHHFLASQPDLNWENPEVRKEMYRIAHWWLDRGVDAFRLDAIHHIGKPAGYPDANEKGMFKNHRNTAETHRWLAEFNAEVFGPRKVFTVGETGGTTIEQAREYTDAERKELDVIFHFRHMYMKGASCMGPSAREFQEHFQLWHDGLSKGGGWDARFWGNHDSPRTLSAFGSEEYGWKLSARFFATLTLSMWGMPFIYQGEELGMANPAYQKRSDWRDIASLRWLEYEIKQGQDPEAMIEGHRRYSRDNSRNPINWDSSEHAGFSTVEPWIPVSWDRNRANAKDELADPDSVFHFYRKLIALRNDYAALRRGSFISLSRGRGKSKTSDSVWAFVRKLEGSAPVLILAGHGNFGGTAYLPDAIEGIPRSGWKVLVCSYSDKKHPEITKRGLPRKLDLRPWEALVLVPKT